MPSFHAMQAFHALPPPSLHADGVLWVGLALVLTTLMGESVLRLLRWPRLIGYTAAGMLIAAGGGGLVAADLPSGVRALIDAALAMLLFEAGHRVNLRWLRANPWLVAISVGEWSVSVVAIYAAFAGAGLRGLPAWAAAAALAGTAPAVALRLSTEFNARGQVTERLLLLSVLGTILSILAVGVLTGWIGIDYTPRWWTALLQQAWSIGGSVVAAAVLAWAVDRVERHFDSADEGATLLLVGLILLVLSATRMMHWSTLLTPLLAGLLLRASSERPRVWPRHFGTAGGALVALLFLGLGLSLNWGDVSAAIGVGLAAALARAIPKLGVPVLLGRPSGLGWRKSAMLGLALNPAAGAAFVLLLDLSAALPATRTLLLPAALAALGVLVLGGTLLARAALGRAGDIPARRD